jgi:chloramphenicol-sensitive protein RarD
VGQDSGSATDTRLKSGLAYGVGAYLMWGAFPIYFQLLDSVPSFVVVASRVIWALVLVVVIVTLGRQWSKIRTQFTPRKLAWSILAGLILVGNWSVYVFAVMNNHVVDASLGYFINPLVTVVLAVVVLHETHSKAQWFSIGLAVVGVAAIAISLGTLPWIGLALALTFASYGLIRKIIGMGSLEGLTLETASVFPIAVAYLFISGEFTKSIDLGWETVALLALAGPVTVFPLLAFASAANRLPLSVVGMLQYITPTMIFILGVVLYQEKMLMGEWLGFFAIWVALAIFSFNVIRHQRKPVDKNSADVEAINAGSNLV